MSHGRNHHHHHHDNSTAYLLLELCGACCGAVASAQNTTDAINSRVEERKAKSAHHQGDHQDASKHYERAALLAHYSGNHEREAHLEHHAEEERRDGNACRII